MQSSRRGPASGAKPRRVPRPRPVRGVSPSHGREIHPPGAQTRAIRLLRRGWPPDERDQCEQNESQWLRPSGGASVRFSRTSMGRAFSPPLLRVPTWRAFFWTWSRRACAPPSGFLPRGAPFLLQFFPGRTERATRQGQAPARSIPGPLWAECSSPPCASNQASPSPNLGRLRRPV